MLAPCGGSDLVMSILADGGEAAGGLAVYFSEPQTLQ